jgi:uracil-DNA glycosylase
MKRIPSLQEKLGPILPPEELVYAAFQECPVARVVIIGQDPYHTPGKARGVAFGYHPDYRGPINSSMLSIIREIGADRFLEEATEEERREWLTLKHWTSQGVLLMNTALTVAPHKPGSHMAYWKDITLALLESQVEGTDVIAVAWGVPARKMAERAGVLPKNLIATSHPCKYSCTRGKRPFVGSGWHLEVNAKLQSRGEKPISWVTGGVFHDVE